MSCQQVKMIQTVPRWETQKETFGHRAIDYQHHLGVRFGRRDGAAKGIKAFALSVFLGYHRHQTRLRYFRRQVEYLCWGFVHEGAECVLLDLVEVRARAGWSLVLTAPSRQRTMRAISRHNVRLYLPIKSCVETAIQY